MKAVAVFPRRRAIELVDHESPVISGPTQVGLRMLEVGICGTDKEIAAFEYGTPPAGSEYLVIGHESLAEVTEVGPGVTRVCVGDLVVPMVRRPCPHRSCLACRSGRQDFCYTGDFTERGIKEAHGFMSERAVEEEEYLSPVPAELREVAVLVEPLTIAEKAIQQVRDVQDRLPWGCPGAGCEDRGYCHRALVLGAGPVGLLGALALHLRGFETVVYSRGRSDGPRASLVASMGLAYVSSRDRTPGQLAAELGQIDLVYEAVGASGLAFEVMKFLGTNAVFIFTGVPGRKAPIELDTDRIMRNLVLRNQVVFGTVNADRSAFAAAIRDLEAFMERWPEAVRSLITGRHSAEECPRLLREGAGGIKNVVVFG